MANTDFDNAAKTKALANEFWQQRNIYNSALHNKHGKKKHSFFFSWDNGSVSLFRDTVSNLAREGTVPSKYIEKSMSWIFDGFVCERHRAAMLYFADRMQEYPYSVSYLRRSYRSNNIASYAERITEMIKSFGDTYYPDYPLDKVLLCDMPEDICAYLDTNAWRGRGYNKWMVAYALDMHDEKVEEAVRNIIIEENGASGVITNDLIAGILISHRVDFHELLCKLLLAARMQEGVRQMICERADEGTKEGFFAILRTIIENDLIRFSAVKRAVGTWLGIISDNTRDLDRISKKTVELMVDCLYRADARAECLASEDAMKIYVALWSLGFDNIESATEVIDRISVSGTRHQLLVAGYFVSGLDEHVTENRIAKSVLRNYSDKDDVVAVWLKSFVHGGIFAPQGDIHRGRSPDYRAWFYSYEELEYFYELMKQLYSSFKGKSRLFSPCVFPWHEEKLEKSTLAELICTLAVYSKDREKIDEACAYIKECDANRRSYCFTCLLSDARSYIQRETVIEGLADKESFTRARAWELVGRMTLSKSEYRMAEEYLRFKGADIRANVMKLLMRQKGRDLSECITRLLDSPKEEMRLAALDMIVQLKKKDETKDLAEGFTFRLVERSKAENLPAKEKILLQTLIPDASPEEKDEELYTDADRYNAYEFDTEYMKSSLEVFMRYFPDSRLGKIFGEGKSSFLDKIKDSVSDRKTSESARLALSDCTSLARLIDAHKEDSFNETYNGDSALLSDFNSFAFGNSRNEGKLPLSELWEGWIADNGIDNGRLLRAYIYSVGYKQQNGFASSAAGFVRDIFGSGFELRQGNHFERHVSYILANLISRIPEEDRRRMAYVLAFWFVEKVDDDSVMLDASAKIGEVSMAHLLAHEQIVKIYQWLECKDDDTLTSFFPLSVALAEKCMLAKAKYVRPIKDKKWYNAQDEYRSDRYLQKPNEDYYDRDSYALIGAEEYLLAACRGIISEGELFEFIFRPKVLRDALDVITSVTAFVRAKDWVISSNQGYSGRRIKLFAEKIGGKSGLSEFTAGIYDRIIPVILKSELSRGDSPEKYSYAIGRIARVFGADTLVSILNSLGKDTIERNSGFYHGTGIDRRSTISHLLAVSLPSETDTADTLREALKGRKISDKRLVEAAMYSPEWIPIVGEYLGEPAFESVCYYFMAHMNESFEERRMAMITRYTPLSEEELNDGAFDVEWFRTAYSSIGEKSFDMIYDSAKYISDGAKHARARKYADAALGRYTVEELEASINDKRNKDLLMAYPLVPIADDDDVCRRYLFLQGFKKQSKQFGSQRMASEGKAFDVAMKNLATNAGYSDTMRLTLRMETKVIDDSRKLLEEHIVDGVALRVIIGEDGKAELSASKDGKMLKSVPAKIKKDKTVIELTDMKKKLNEQYRRTRIMLEQAMEDSSVFTFGELLALTEHPVVYPMLSKLIFVGEGISGLIVEGGILSHSGEVRSLPVEAELRIAHPFDLYSRGEWREYQRYLFENSIVQPFRQVFRELYTKTEEESVSHRSMRYSGNQIQPAKTVAALKSRRWVADVENGLQKVYYKQDIVVRIYAMADWFTPADIEAPTLEWVCFENRRTGDEIKIADIPDIIFSEVMRDVDLAVSVAHAGGVDPEASHSTVEMRAAIVSFLLTLLKLSNVKVEGQHALICGKIANYSVHLGSGVVHQVGGTMIPVLPVHSQHRGRIFLPFVDDDPKTAEIISKVILFAEDGKIKDPNILSHIMRGV